MVAPRPVRARETAPTGLRGRVEPGRFRPSPHDGRSGESAYALWQSVACGGSRCTWVEVMWGIAKSHFCDQVVGNNPYFVE